MLSSSTASGIANTALAYRCHHVGEVDCYIEFTDNSTACCKPQPDLLS